MFFKKEIVHFVNVEADPRLQDLLHLQNNPHEAREKPILAICFERPRGAHKPKQVVSVFIPINMTLLH
jgi:hypothetical protein